MPLLDTVVKRLTDLGHERRLRQIVMGNAIRLGPEQVPEVWATYVRCGGILDLDEVPDLYVVNDPEINAMTIGAKTPIVIVNSSMLRSFDAKEVETVLGARDGPRALRALLPTRPRSSCSASSSTAHCRARSSSDCRCAPCTSRSWSGPAPPSSRPTGPPRW